MVALITAVISFTIRPVRPLLCHGKCDENGTNVSEKILGHSGKENEII